MKRWIAVGIIAILLITIGITVYVVSTAVATGQVIESHYVETAITHSPLQQVSSTAHYFGTEHYVVLYGHDEQDQQMIVWIHEDKSKIYHALLVDGIGEESILDQVTNDFQVNDTIQITPGIENEIFVWEAVFQTGKGQFVYVYYDFFTGELLRSIQMKK